jgi:hypothetical protein
MSQERFQGLALRSVERSFARKLNFSEVIDRFAEVKARKMDY